MGREVKEAGTVSPPASTFVRSIPRHGKQNRALASTRMQPWFLLVWDTGGGACECHHTIVTEEENVEAALAAKELWRKTRRNRRVSIGYFGLIAVWKTLLAQNSWG
jgi:hypothetical protein